MMTVCLSAGLGNQMFQYAFGRSVSLARGEDVLFTRDRFDIPDSIRCYALDAFKVPIKFAPGLQDPIYWENPYSFNPRVYTVGNGMSFDGQWQTEKYFDAPTVRKAFALPHLEHCLGEKSYAVAADILRCGESSAFLHVRRTDYLEGLNPGHHGNMSIEYYRSAIARIKEEIKGVKFFVFSDDPEWCRQAFPEFRTVDHNRPGGRYFGSDVTGREHEDIWLMSLCRHAVIANSTFSWWGAWLGDDRPGRIVIAPDRWFSQTSLDYKDIVPERWTKI